VFVGVAMMVVHHGSIDDGAGLQIKFPGGLRFAVACLLCSIGVLEVLTMIYGGLQWCRLSLVDLCWFRSR